MKNRTEDKVISEIRAARCRISEECGNDVSRLVEHLKSLNVKYAKQVRMYEKEHKSARQSRALEGARDRRDNAARSFGLGWAPSKELQRAAAENIVHA